MRGFAGLPMVRDVEDANFAGLKQIRFMATGFTTFRHIDPEGRSGGKFRLWCKVCCKAYGFNSLCSPRDLRN